MFNAESSTSPIRNGSSRIYPNQDRSTCKKNFPEKRYGNNTESPNFLQLPKIYNNSFANGDIYTRDEHIIENKKPLNNNSAMHIRELKQFTSKPNFIINRNLELSSDNINLPRTNRLQNSQNSLSAIIYPKVSQDDSAYLKNINEFHVRESYIVDNNRSLKYHTKPQEDYNPIADRRLYMSPVNVKFDKWPLFYEK